MSEAVETRRMQRVRYDFVVEAEQPIAHHAETVGNEAILMRRKIRQADGSFAQVPIVTADTMRHGMREAGAYMFLDAVGMVDSPALSEAALRLLFNGGMVSGRGDASSVKFDDYRRLCDMVPALEVLGGCAQNRIIPGYLNVDDATLICRESERFIPDHVRAWAQDHGGVLGGAREHVEEVQRVRMDPSLSPGKRQLLAGSEQAKALDRVTRSEAASESEDALAQIETKSTMMPRRFERLVQGALFYWGCEAIVYTPLALDTFRLACMGFLARATVGGKRGTGHGRLRAIKAWDIDLARPRDILTAAEPTSLGLRVGELFRSHVQSRRDEVLDFLRVVDA